MEQRLRLVQGGQSTAEREADVGASQPRRPRPDCLEGCARQYEAASVVTRDVSEHGVSVECLNGAAIPLYRLVYFQVDREARHRPDLPDALRKPNVLSAIFRVGADNRATGAPSSTRSACSSSPRASASRRARTA